jgi:hypothetical protein
MSADRHEFRDPKLITEFDILPPEEGSGRKTDVAHCHHCSWKQALHAPRMKQHLRGIIASGSMPTMQLPSGEG